MYKSVHLQAHPIPGKLALERTRKKKQLFIFIPERKHYNMHGLQSNRPGFKSLFYYILDVLPWETSLVSHSTLISEMRMLAVAI